MIKDGGFPGLVIRPGDTLLVAFNDTLTQQDFAEAMARLRDALPDDVKIVAVRPAQIAVYRPDPAPGVGAPCDPA